MSTDTTHTASDTTVSSAANPTSTERAAVTHWLFAGLDYYTENDARWFFGREAERRTIGGNLRAGRLTLLYGESGVGKSSLLRAGVAAGLLDVARQQVARRGAPQFVPVLFNSWKDEPVDALIAAIEAGIREFVTKEISFELPRTSLDAAIRSAGEVLGATLLIILDQFEEYFLYRAGERPSGRFADELARCVNDPDVRANFLIGIREDAYAGLGDLFATQIPTIYNNHLHLEHLSREGAREAIEGPIRTFNEDHEDRAVEIEPGLVDAVLDEVVVRNDGVPGDLATTTSGDRPVSTPLLQLVMKALWEHEEAQSSRVLRLSVLEQLQVATIVDAHLRQALRTLSNRERQVAIEAFDHLVTASGGKIAEPVADLAERTGYPEAEVSSVLDKMDHERIVRPVPAPPGRDAHRFRRYEIFHDVLAPAISRVIAANMVEQRLRRARKFVVLAASLLVLVVGVAAVIVVLWQQSNDRRAVAQSEQLASQARAVVGSDPELSTLLALQALKIHRTPDAASALGEALPNVQELRTIHAGPRGTINSASFNPQGTMVVVATSSGNADIFDAKTGASIKQIPVTPGQSLNSVFFSPNGQQILASSNTGADYLVSVTSDHVSRLGPRLKHFSLDAVFGDHGNKIATVTDGTPGGVTIWTSSGHGAFTAPRTFTVPQREPTKAVNYIYSTSISSDGTRVATANGDGSIDVFDISTGQLVQALNSGDNAIPNAVTFSPMGNNLIAVYNDGKMIVWNATNGTEVNPPILIGGSAQSAAYKADGSQAVTSNDLGQATVWDLKTGAAVTHLNSHVGFVLTAAFSTSGARVVTANEDGTVKIWDAANRSFGTLLRDHSMGTTPISEVIAVPGYQDVIAANWNGQVTIWNPNNGGTREFNGSTSGIAHLALSPDETRLIAVNIDHSVLVWDMRQVPPKPLAPIVDNSYNVAAYGPRNETFFGFIAYSQQPGYGYLYACRSCGKQKLDTGPGDVASAVFNRQGTELLTANFAGPVKLWNVATHKRLIEFDDAHHPLSVVDASFSSDAKFVVTADSLGHAIVYDAQTGQVIADLFAGTGQINSAVFALGNDNEVVTSGDDGYVRVWNVSTQSVLVPFSAAGSLAMNTAVFNLAGNEIIAGSVDGTVRIWRADVSTLPALIERANDTVTRQLTAEERKAYNIG